MSKTDVFLSAEWRHLVMLNYEVDPAILQPVVPIGTELDLWNGKAIISLVGFMFLNTRVMSIPVPFHMNFEEVNLRYYLKREHPEGSRRGVAFIKEIVPRWGIAYLAKTLYNENYVSMPMRHCLEENNGTLSAQYDLHYNDRWHCLGLICKGLPKLPSKGSEAEFITDHYWGYVAQPDGRTIEYRVEHPQWRIWNADDIVFDVDVGEIYGEKFAHYLNQKPVSTFLAEGSPVTVSKRKLHLINE